MSKKKTKVIYIQDEVTKKFIAIPKPKKTETVGLSSKEIDAWFNDLRKSKYALRGGR